MTREPRVSPEMVVDELVYMQKCADAGRTHCFSRSERNALLDLADARAELAAKDKRIAELEAALQINEGNQDMKTTQIVGACLLCFGSGAFVTASALSHKVERYAKAAAQQRLAMDETKKQIAALMASIETTTTNKWCCACGAPMTSEKSGQKKPDLPPCAKSLCILPKGTQQ